MRKLTPIILAAFALCLGSACSKGGFQSESAQSTASPATTPSTTAPSATPAPTTTATGLPTPPSNAQTFTALEQTRGWQSCNSTACAGGSGKGTYWMNQDQSAPSLDGNSMELYNSGARANSLWWQQLGASNSAINFLWDFYAQVDESASTSAQALEFDSFQFVGGNAYMFGSQCDLAVGKWDVWDESDGDWIHTRIPCTQFEPNVWHHIQWYVQRIADTEKYTFVTLVVDGTTYSVNQTYSARYTGWADNVGIQYQLDVNAKGTGYHEWVDESTLTIW